MTKQFKQPMDKRTVEVEIKDGSIDFSFAKEDMRQWFYDIPISEWTKDYPRWQDHMREKRWFTPEMEKFINENTKTASI